MKEENTYPKYVCHHENEKPSDADLQKVVQIAREIMADEKTKPQLPTVELVWENCPKCSFDSKFWQHCDDHGDEEEVAACAWEGYGV